MAPTPTTFSGGGPGALAVHQTNEDTEISVVRPDPLVVA